MAEITERLLDFPVKNTPVPADIIYCGDSANSFIEVQITIEGIIGAYPSLLSIGELAVVANKMLYSTNVDEWALADITAFGRSLIDDADATAGRATLGLGTAATLNASDASKAFLASLDAVPVTIGNLPVFTDINGTLGDSGFTPSGFQVVGQVRGATTANLAGYTYANGTGGVGATLTAGGNGAFTSDGISWLQGDYVLVHNQSNTFENGIYQITVLGTVSTPAVLTRATFYNQPSEINKGDLVIVAEGTLYNQTSWMETADVVTIGTDPITFVQFTANPATFLKVASNLSDVASVATSRINLGLTFTGQNVVVFDSSGSWNVPAGISRAYGIAWGAGGGGGSNTNSAFQGGGGGAGARAEDFFTVTPGGTVTITIGTGGTGATANTTNNGSAGGDTSIGSSVIAKGGSGGGGANGAATGGLGGTAAASTGSVKMSGGKGGSSFTASPLSGAGGNSPGNSANQVCDVAGTAPIANSGAGGTGGATAANAANGANGKVVIFY